LIEVVDPEGVMVMVDDPVAVTVPNQISWVCGVPEVST
jgi:hypothetical protein